MLSNVIGESKYRGACLNYSARDLLAGRFFLSRLCNYSDDNSEGYCSSLVYEVDTVIELNRTGLFLIPWVR